MSITFPLSASAFWETLRFASRPEFTLAYNTKQSMDGAGNILGAIYGPAKWAATVPLEGGRHNANLDAESSLKALVGRFGTFLAYDIRSPYPDADPYGVFLDGGSLVVLGGEAAYGDVSVGTYRYEGGTVTLAQAVSVVGDAGTYFDIDGVLQTSASNTLRVDHDPVTHAVRGVLVEIAYSNYLLRSEELDNASWTKNASTITANAVAAPDGTTTADKIVDTTAVATQHGVSQTYASFVSGQVYTVSAYLKAAEMTFAQIAFNGSAFSTPQRASIDLTSGAIAVVQGTPTASVENCGNGWFRLAVTATATSTASAGVLVYLSTSAASGGVTFTGTSAQGIYCWGVQMNGGSLRSYLKTTTAIVARAADALTIKAIGQNDWTLIYDNGTTSPGSNVVGNWGPSSADISRPRVKGWSAIRDTLPSASTVQIKSKGSNNRSLALKGLPPFFRVTKGDKISVLYSTIKYFLCEAMETVTADYLGETAEFEISPAKIPAGTAVNDAVTLKKPLGKFKVTEQRTASGQGNISSGLGFSMISVP